MVPATGTRPIHFVTFTVLRRILSRVIGEKNSVFPL